MLMDKNVCVIRSNEMHFIFKFIPINPLHVSNRLTVQHYQCSTLIVSAASQRGNTINATDCMYSKLPPEDGQLIYSKHVEDIYWNKFKKEAHLVGSYYANESQCTVRIMSNLLI